MTLPDINSARLEFAGNYAASSTFLPPPLEPNEKRMDYSRRATALLREKLGLPERGTGSVDVVIEASGAEVCVQMGCFLVREEGKYVQGEFGLSVFFATRPAFSFCSRENRLLIISSCPTFWRL